MIDNDEVITKYWISLDLMIWYENDTFEWVEACSTPPEMPVVDDFVLSIVCVNIVKLNRLKKYWWKIDQSGFI